MSNEQDLCPLKGDKAILRILLTSEKLAAIHKLKDRQAKRLMGRGWHILPTSLGENQLSPLTSRAIEAMSQDLNPRDAPKQTETARDLHVTTCRRGEACNC